MTSSQNLIDDSALLLVHQGKVLQIALKQEPLVIQTEQMQKRRVIVAVAYRIAYRAMTELIGRSMNVAPFDSATGQPHAEAVGVVVASHGIRSRVVLNDREATH